MKGFNPGKGTGMGSAFHQNEKRMMRTARKLERKTSEYEPQTVTRKDIETDITPQTTMKKRSVYKKADWATAKKAATAKGWDLSDLAKQRNALRDAGDTSSDEYKKIQNKINEAYGVSKRYQLSKEDKNEENEKRFEVDGVKMTKEQYDHYNKTGEMPDGTVHPLLNEDDAPTTEEKLEGHKGQKDFDVDPTAGNVKEEKKKNTSDPFAGGGSGEDKFDRKKFKDTKVGQFLGVGKGDERKARRTKRKADRQEKKAKKNWQKSLDRGDLDAVAYLAGIDPELNKTDKGKRRTKRKQIKAAREKKREARKTKGRKSEEFQTAKADVKRLKEEKRAI